MKKIYQSKVNKVITTTKTTKYISTFEQSILTNVNQITLIPKLCLEMHKKT